MVPGANRGDSATSASAGAGGNGPNENRRGSVGRGRRSPSLAQSDANLPGGVSAPTTGVMAPVAPLAGSSQSDTQSNNTEAELQEVAVQMVEAGEDVAAISLLEYLQAMSLMDQDIAGAATGSDVTVNRDEWTAIRSALIRSRQAYETEQQAPRDQQPGQPQTEPPAQQPAGGLMPPPRPGRPPLPPLPLPRDAEPLARRPSGAFLARKDQDKPADPFKLQRFVDAQNHGYRGTATHATALQEMQAGMKRTHWSWYELPIVSGFGQSALAKYFALNSLEEARAYYAHDTLRGNLIAMFQSINSHGDKSIREIMGGEIDAAKLKSCATLFFQVTKDPIFLTTLDLFFAGSRCQTAERRLFQWQQGT